MKLSPIKILFIILTLNPVLSLFFDNTNMYYHYITYPVILILILVVEQKQRMLFQISAIVCGVVVLCEIVAITGGSPLGKLHNHLFNYVDAILLMLFITNPRNMKEFDQLIKGNLKLFRNIVVIINFVEAFMLVTQRGYVYVWSWHGNFFQGTNSMPHTLSYLMLATMIFDIVYVIYTKKKWFACMAVLPVFCVFASGARVSLALAGIMTCILLSFVMSEKQKNLIMKVIKILPLVLLALAVFWNRIINSDFMNKVISRSVSGNSTAGRTYIWRDLLTRYIQKSNIVHYFFGQGDDKSYYFNLNNPLVGVEVWAHNDLVQIIIGKGLAGIVMYIIALAKFFRTMIKRSGNIYTLAIIVFVILAIMLNGFYSYRDINMCIPFLMIMNEKLSYRKEVVETYE